MRSYFLFIILLVSTTVGFSQEKTYSFTLEQAIAFALENNYSAINADRDIIDAQKQKWEVIASGLPQLSGAVNYQNQLKLPVSLIPAGNFGGEPGEFLEVVFGVPQTLTATATLRQKLFDGTYIVGVQATKSFLSYSANNKEKTKLDVRKAVTEAYGNVLLARESVAISEKNKDNLEKNLFETTKIYENGLGDEESVEQLQITLANVENQLRNAIRLEEITLQMLNLMMGIDIDAPTQLEEQLDDLTRQQIDLAIVNDPFNIENNVDYKLAINLNEQRFYEWKQAKSRALPSLDAFINYGSSAFGERSGFLDSDQRWFDFSTFGVDLSIPIFSSGLRSAGTARAKIALEKAKTQLEEAEAQIRLQVERAKSDYTLAIEQYDTSKENLALAERIEQKNQIKYSEGVATSFELRQAQTQLYDAQQEYLQSMVDVINKKTELETVMNNNP
ncbi:TolC family protein [Flavobacteriaceae bacterium TP-CH-4]|uniref:TolC family protein n=1 Tax=Pelagihabitans pacificus TaxID=2696054 RepID=A0A967E787_9FLAO|nr:TolC family protein [Pelagihabitans pacificus]NHF60405.1 TolC family protein [Pelagihabitans pacificus]